MRLRHYRFGIDFARGATPAGQLGKAGVTWTLTLHFGRWSRSWSR